MKIIRDKEGHYIMKKVSILLDITIFNVSVSQKKSVKILEEKTDRNAGRKRQIHYYN